MSANAIRATAADRSALPPSPLIPGSARLNTMYTETVPPPRERQDPLLMREMFGTIAPRYDFVTRIFSYGMDRRWKRLGVQRAALPEDAVALDLAAGTGDFSQLLCSRFPRARAIAVDLALPMLRVARRRGVM